MNKIRIINNVPLDQDEAAKYLKAWQSGAFAKSQPESIQILNKGTVKDVIERRALADYLKQSKAKTFTASQISRSGPRRFRGRLDAVERLLRTLAEQGCGTYEFSMTPSGGRPSRKFKKSKGWGKEVTQ